MTRQYIVRDAIPGSSPRASYPYNLRGLQDALERAAFASANRGIPQEVAVVGEDWRAGDPPLR